MAWELLILVSVGVNFYFIYLLEFSECPVLRHGDGQRVRKYSAGEGSIQLDDVFLEHLTWGDILVGSGLLVFAVGSFRNLGLPDIV